MYILAPSLLAADFTKLGEQIKETERCGAQFLHIDVMDGIFVPSISFGMPLIESIRPATKQFFDVHLMIVCLLYTSLSPRDRQTSRMPSSA